MKGLKTLTAVLRGDGAAGERGARLRASAAAYKHYVACGVSQNAKPAHLCQKGRKKGAFFKSLKADVFYSVCVKFPTGKNLCARSTGSDPGDALREQDHLEHPRQAPVTWFVEGKRVGSFVFRVTELDGAALTSSASTPRPPTPPPAPGATARSSTSRCSGLSPDGEPAARDRAARPRSSARPRRPAAGSAVDLIAVGARARLLHRPADRHRHGAGAGGRASACRSPASARSTRSDGGWPSARPPERAASPSSTPAAARSSPPSTAAGGERLWEPLVCRPEELGRARRRAARAPAGGRFGGGTISR